MEHNAETGDLFDFTDLDKKLTEAHYNRALGYLRLGELELATKAAQTVLKINQDYPPALSLLELIRQEYFVRGLTAIKEDKVNEGIRAFQSIIATFPKGKSCSNYQKRGVSEKRSVAGQKMLHFPPNYFFQKNNQIRNVYNPDHHWVYYRGLLYTKCYTSVTFFTAFECPMGV